MAYVAPGRAWTVDEIDVARRLCRMVNAQDRRTFDAVYEWAGLDGDYRQRAAVTAIAMRLLCRVFLPLRPMVGAGRMIRRRENLLDRIATSPFTDLVDLVVARGVLGSVSDRTRFDAQNTPRTATTLIVLGASALGRYGDRETCMDGFEQSIRRGRGRVGTAPWFVLSGWLANDSVDSGEVELLDETGVRSQTPPPPGFQLEAPCSRADFIRSLPYAITRRPV